MKTKIISDYLAKDSNCQEMAEFFGYDPRRVTYWRQSLPKGKDMAKVIFFLTETKGLKVSGIRKDSPAFYGISLLASDKLGVKQLAALLGVKYGYDAYRFLFGKRPITNEKGELLRRAYTSLYQEAPIKETDSLISKFTAMTDLLAFLEPRLDDYLNSSPANRRFLREALEEKGISLFQSSNSLYRVVKKMNRLCSEKSFSSSNPKF